jgi:hypothetical protein
LVGGNWADAAMWRDDDADSRANLAIEGMVLTDNEHAFFDMLRDEAAPLPSPPCWLRRVCGAERHPRG